MPNTGHAFATLVEGGVFVETRFLDELHRKIAELIAASPAKDIEKNLRALLSSAFSRLDLVTREEFDVQRDVLGRTRDKLQEMEARVAEMEKSLAGLGDHNKR
jgi:BMFP domain-containing protein YqiC